MSILHKRSKVRARADAFQSIGLYPRGWFPGFSGHLLIVPNRHVADWFDLTVAEQQAIMALVEQGKEWAKGRFQPDGYNIGMNCGEAAGQTVMHMHCHLIPRYAGDRSDPRGGVRWVIPEKADYWSGR